MPGAVADLIAVDNTRLRSIELKSNVLPADKLFKGK